MAQASLRLKINFFKDMWALWGSLFINTGFLMANALTGAIFGFLSWVIAARTYDAAQVGLGAAYIAAIIFLAQLGEMGLGYTLIRFVPSMGSEQINFINSGFLAVAGCTLIFALIFVLGAPTWSSELIDLTQIGWTLVFFILSHFRFRHSNPWRSSFQFIFRNISPPT